jgi:hypothetical protein
MKHSTEEPAYLIIGGTTKAATTSVYKYLRDHPEVCGSSLKETRFFLNPSYPTPIPETYVDSEKEGYKQYFRACTGEPVRLEATPTYLYSEQTPGALQHYLPEVRCVFILRDPIDRLVSWYRFAKQNGEISMSISFKEYIDRQMSEESGEVSSPWRVLKQGRYARYLRNYIEVFEEGEVHVEFFKYVVEEPELSLNRISRFAGVDSKFFDEYTFTVYNKTRHMKSPFLHSIYLRLLRAVRYRIHTWPRIHNALRRLRSCLDPIYLALAANEEEAVEVPTGLRNRLRQYYAADATELTEILGRRPPWCTSNES